MVYTLLSQRFLWSVQHEKYRMKSATTSPFLDGAVFEMKREEYAVANRIRSLHLGNKVVSYFEQMSTIPLMSRIH